MSFKLAESSVRVAQIGCGYWGKNLLRVLMESGDHRSRRGNLSPAVVGRRGVRDADVLRRQSGQQAAYGLIDA